MLNQEIFEKNLNDQETRTSFDLEIPYMEKLLKKDTKKMSVDPTEYQLSIFDFFREIILS